MQIQIFCRRCPDNKTRSEGEIFCNPQLYFDVASVVGDNLKNVVVLSI